MKNISLPDHQISIQRLERLEEFQEIKNEWNALFKRNPNQSLFLSWAWQYSWWKIYQPGKELWLLILREKDALVGIAPFMLIHQKRYPVQLRILQTLGTPHADIGGFLQDGNNPNIEIAVFEYLKEMKKSWDVLELNEFSEQYHEIIAAKTSFSSQEYLQVSSVKEHYYISTQGNWQDYYNSLSKKFRKNLRRSVRNADGLGKVELRGFFGDKLTWPLFEKIIEINRHAHYPRLAHSQLEQKFHQELLRNMATTSSMIAYMLFIDDQAAAYEYGFLHNGHFENWRAGFDKRHDPTVSIGILLSLKITEDAFEQNYQEIDFLRGDEDYKKNWRPFARQFTSMRIFQSWKLQSLLAYIWLRYLKPQIKNWN